MIRTMSVALKAAFRDNKDFDPENNAQNRREMLNYILNVTVCMQLWRRSFQHAQHTAGVILYLRVEYLGCSITPDAVAVLRRHGFGC